MATCFDTVQSSSGLPKNRYNVSKFIVHSGISNTFGIPECTINFDTLDLFFGNQRQRLRSQNAL
jgi:hypothetical protein